MGRFDNSFELIQIAATPKAMDGRMWPRPRVKTIEDSRRILYCAAVFRR